MVAVDRDSDGAARVAKTIQQQGGEALSVGADVTQAGDVQRYVKAATDGYGRIDCFFNNAGIEGRVAPIAEYDEAVFDAVVGVNLKGVFLGLRHVLPVMIAQGSGAIVNTGSIAGLVGTPGMGAYVASKHAVLGLTKSVSGEVARQGVRVNAVCPGPVDTRMIHAIEAQIDPSDAEAVGAHRGSIRRTIRLPTKSPTWCCSCSDLASGITGAHYVIDDGRTATGSAVTTTGPSAEPPAAHPPGIRDRRHHAVYVAPIRCIVGPAHTIACCKRAPVLAWSARHSWPGAYGSGAFVPVCMTATYFHAFKGT